MDLEMRQMIELVVNNIKTVRQLYRISPGPRKKIEHDIFRNREEIIIKQMKLLEMKITVSEMKRYTGLH